MTQEIMTETTIHFVRINLHFVQQQKNRKPLCIDSSGPVMKSKEEIDQNIHRWLK